MSGEKTATKTSQVLIHSVIALKTFGNSPIEFKFKQVTRVNEHNRQVKENSLIIIIIGLEYDRKN